MLTRFPSAVASPRAVLRYVFLDSQQNRMLPSKPIDILLKIQGNYQYPQVANHPKTIPHNPRENLFKNRIRAWNRGRWSIEDPTHDKRRSRKAQNTLTKRTQNALARVVESRSCLCVSDLSPTWSRFLKRESVRPRGGCTELKQRILGCLAIPNIVKMRTDQLLRVRSLEEVKEDIPEWTDQARGIFIALVKDRRAIWDSRFKVAKERVMQLFKDVSNTLVLQDQRMNEWALLEKWCWLVEVYLRAVSPETSFPWRYTGAMSFLSEFIGCGYQYLNCIPKERIVHLTAIYATQNEEIEAMAKPLKCVDRADRGGSTVGLFKENAQAYAQRMAIIAENRQDPTLTVRSVLDKIRKNGLTIAMAEPDGQASTNGNSSSKHLTPAAAIEQYSAMMSNMNSSPEQSEPPLQPRKRGRPKRFSSASSTSEFEKKPEKKEDSPSPPQPKSNGSAPPTKRGRGRPSKTPVRDEPVKQEPAEKEESEVKSEAGDAEPTSSAALPHAEIEEEPSDGKVKFTEPMYKFLADFVRHKPLLWHTRHPNRNVPHMRIAIFEEIVQQMRILMSGLVPNSVLSALTGEAMSEAWDYLSDKFQEEEKNFGQQSTWELFKELHFLSPQVMQACMYEDIVPRPVPRNYSYRPKSGAAPGVANPEPEPRPITMTNEALMAKFNPSTSASEAIAALLANFGGDRSIAEALAIVPRQLAAMATVPVATTSTSSSSTSPSLCAAPSDSPTTSDGPELGFNANFSNKRENKEFEGGPPSKKMAMSPGQQSSNGNYVLINDFGKTPTTISTWVPPKEDPDQMSANRRMMKLDVLGSSSMEAALSKMTAEGQQKPPRCPPSSPAAHQLLKPGSPVPMAVTTANGVPIRSATLQNSSIGASLKAILEKKPVLTVATANPPAPAPPALEPQADKWACLGRLIESVCREVESRNMLLSLQLYEAMHSLIFQYQRKSLGLTQF
ncbi:unnamed protein product [Caenorhabditis auriculariae]|uniref:MADF domain-containing protein n=1 Tax=Caenorhabditis auriculariae TaxID=2777116 RepID=A0A8S1HE70_9PELO|nr:unnamed protein product [Caenorhabditis auriculariae]